MLYVVIFISCLNVFSAEDTPTIRASTPVHDNSISHLAHVATGKGRVKCRGGSSVGIRTVPAYASLTGSSDPPPRPHSATAMDPPTRAGTVDLPPRSHSATAMDPPTRAGTVDLPPRSHSATAMDPPTRAGTVDPPPRKRKKSEDTGDRALATITRYVEEVLIPASAQSSHPRMNDMEQKFGDLVATNLREIQDPLIKLNLRNKIFAMIGDAALADIKQRDQNRNNVFM